MTKKKIALIVVGALVAVYALLMVQKEVLLGGASDKECTSHLATIKTVLEHREWDLAEISLKTTTPDCAEKHRSEITQLQARLVEDKVFFAFATPIDAVWARYDANQKNIDILRAAYQQTLQSVPGVKTQTTERLAKYVDAEYRKRAIALGFTGDPFRDGM